MGGYQMCVHRYSIKRTCDKGTVAARVDNFINYFGFEKCLFAMLVGGL